MAINLHGLTESQINANKSQKQIEKNTPDKNLKTGTEMAVLNDEVNFSAQAKSLTEIENKIKAASSVDQEKVNRIKDAISNGEYTINHERLAAAFERLEHEL